MSATIDALLNEDPKKWVDCLPQHQRRSLDILFIKGMSFETAAETWLTVTATNSFPFGTIATGGDKAAYLATLKREVAAFLCGDEKYSKERTKLFGEKAPTHSLIVSSLAAALAPHIGMAASVLATLIALVLASLGKVTLTAWCELNYTKRVS